MTGRAAQAVSAQTLSSAPHAPHAPVLMQSSMMSTLEMLRERTVPGDLPDLCQSWHIEHAAADHFVAASRRTREKWYLLWQPLPTAAHELQQRPVTYQESPWVALHSHHHVLW